MTNLQIRNVPDEIHQALQSWAKEEQTSLSALVLNQLRQRLELREFERTLRELPTTDTAQDTVAGLHEERRQR